MFTRGYVSLVETKKSISHGGLVGDVDGTVHDDPPTGSMENPHWTMAIDGGPPVSPSDRLVYVTIYSNDVSTRNSCRNLLDLTDFIPY
jgi:hypothetical protein